MGNRGAAATQRSGTKGATAAKAPRGGNFVNSLKCA